MTCLSSPASDNLENHFFVSKSEDGKRSAKVLRVLSARPSGSRESVLPQYVSGHYVLSGLEECKPLSLDF